MTGSRAPISVIIPMFNSADTIERALGSVAEQILLPGDVFVIDDGSSDQSREIVTRWNNPAISVTLIEHLTNLGPSASRNSGWVQATGDFVAFLDADDAWHPKKLSIQYKFMTEHENLVLCGHSYEIVEGHCGWPEITSSREYGAFSFNDFLFKNRLSTPTVMIKRDVTNRFAPEQRFSEDYRLWLEIVKQHGSAYFLELPLTRLFKPTIGETGLSSKMLSMYIGELSTVLSLYRSQTLGFCGLVISLFWLTVKFTRRKLRIIFSKIRKSENRIRRSNA